MDAGKILVVEDDPNLLSVLKYNLTREGYRVATATSGDQAVEIARREKPELIILDVMLPGISGFEVCRILRRDMTVPVLMLTARADETEKIIGLEIGADDYVTKPFSMRELLARIRAMRRRAGMSGSPPDGETSFKINDLEIDPARHRATIRGKKLELTPKAFDLLAYLVQNRGFVFSREQLLNQVWSYEYAGDTRTVDVHIRWLRQKIEADPRKPAYLVTVRGAGYKMEG
ncbi:MAG: response regulator transcription factor [Chloroflexota bacterium]